jgi:predicted RNA-binding protein with PUA-like domain
MPKSDRCWLVKQEPTAYSWDNLVKDARTAWTGVRNFQARNHLRAMCVGDLVLFYHSVIGKAVVGIAKVVRDAYPDPTATEDGWICVDLAPVRALARPVTLDQIKATGGLEDIPLLRQARLSVQPLTPRQFDAIVALSENQ